MYVKVITTALFEIAKTATRLSHLNASHAATRDLGPSSTLATLSVPRTRSKGPGQQALCVQVLEGEARTHYG